MSKSSFFIIGKHAVLEALKNPKRKVLRLFLTEESKKTIHRNSPRKNLLKDQKIFFKTKKELDKYTRNEGIQHQGFVAEIEHLEKIQLKDFIKNKKNFTIACLDEITDPRNIGSIIREIEGSSSSIIPSSELFTRKSEIKTSTPSFCKRSYESMKFRKVLARNSGVINLKISSNSFLRLLFDPSLLIIIENSCRRVFNRLLRLFIFNE